MLSTRYYSASRVGGERASGEDDELYAGFDDVSPALDTRALRDDQHFQEALKTATVGRKLPSRMGTALFRQGTAGVRMGSSRAGTATARPMTGVRAVGYTSVARASPVLKDKDDSVEDKIKQMETRIMKLVEESCMLSARQPRGDDSGHKSPDVDLGKALAKAQEASTLERQLIRMQEQANLGDSHNLDLTFAVLCNLADQYSLNEMYTEALNTYQLLTRNKLFPHSNRLKVNMGNIYFKMGEHPKALKLYRMALDQTPTAEKDLRMKVMHNIGLLLVRMGKFRDAVTNFQHIMHEQGDYLTGLHLVLCAVALGDSEAAKGAFHAMLDVEQVSAHQDIEIDDEEEDAQCAVLRDVLVADRLSAWSRAAAAAADRRLALAAAAAAAASPHQPGNIGWCVEALRGAEAGAGGGAGARLELGAALGALGAARRGGARARAERALQRVRAVARAHTNDRAVRAEANADAAFLTYAMGNYSEARSLAETACREDPYSSTARATLALASARLHDGGEDEGLASVVDDLTAASMLDVADLRTMHNLALSLEASGDPSLMSSAAARWSAVRSAGAGAGGGRAGGGGDSTLRAFAAAGLARLAAAAGDVATADHWYSSVGTWDAGVSGALAALHAAAGDTLAAKHHYQDVEAAWPCALTALQWLGDVERAGGGGGGGGGVAGVGGDGALAYYRRAQRLQPDNPQWGLLMGGCLRASGHYQEALELFKKMNARFPDNVQCLKLIVKLCGDQGRAETAAWSRELQRAQARAKQDRVPMPSAGSLSSETSQSPIEHVKGSRASSGARVPSGRSGPSTASTATDSFNGGISQENGRMSKPLKRSISRKNTVETFEDDLPLPPE